MVFSNSSCSFPERKDYWIMCSPGQNGTRNTRMTGLPLFSSHISEKRGLKSGLTCQMRPASPPLPKNRRRLHMALSRLSWKPKTTLDISNVLPVSKAKCATAMSVRLPFLKNTTEPRHDLVFSKNVFCRLHGRRWTKANQKPGHVFCKKATAFMT